MDHQRRTDGRVSVTLIKGCSLRSTCGSVLRSLSRTTACGSDGIGARFVRDRGLAHDGVTSCLTTVSNIIVYPKFKRHKARKGVVTTRCYQARSVPALNVYLNVRVVIVRFTHGMLNLRGTGSRRVSPSAPRGIVSLVRRRGDVARVNKAVELKTCSYRLSAKSGIFRTCKGSRVRRHRHRQCRFDDPCHQRFRRTKVLYANVGPSDNLIRVIRVPTYQ